MTNTKNEKDNVMTQQLDTHEGYMENAQGHLVPLDRVQPIDRTRNEVVLEAIQRGKALQEHMRKTKADLMADVSAFVSLSAEEYGVKYGGQKGNVTLVSYNGQYKIVRSMAEYITFDERLKAAQELIRQCMTDWTEGASANLCALVENAFATDKDGNVSTGRIMGLRRLPIKDDARWDEAMRAINDSIQVMGSKPYIRLYERDSNGKYQPIAMDMATI